MLLTGAGGLIRRMRTCATDCEVMQNLDANHPPNPTPSKLKLIRHSARKARSRHLVHQRAAVALPDGVGDDRTVSGPARAGRGIRQREACPAAGETARSWPCHAHGNPVPLQPAPR